MLSVSSLTLPALPNPQCFVPAVARGFAVACLFCQIGTRLEPDVAGVVRSGALYRHRRESERERKEKEICIRVCPLVVSWWSFYSSMWMKNMCFECQTCFLCFFSNLRMHWHEQDHTDVLSNRQRGKWMWSAGLPGSPSALQSVIKHPAGSWIDGLADIFADLRRSSALHTVDSFSSLTHTLDADHKHRLLHS